MIMNHTIRVFSAVLAFAAWGTACTAEMADTEEVGDASEALRCQLCGNGVVNQGEECDDGNHNNRDGCTNQCRLRGSPNPPPSTCGNGDVDPGEECDDGNSVNTDQCTNVCRIPVCGDAIVQGGLGEECDDGNANDNDACGNDCLAN
jgi:cysteine-rich repeat protein